MRHRAGQLRQRRHFFAAVPPSSCFNAGSRTLSPKGVDCARMVARFDAPYQLMMACTAEDSLHGTPPTLPSSSATPLVVPTSAARCPPDERATDGDAVGAIAVLLCLRAQEAHRGLDVVHIGREARVLLLERKSTLATAKPSPTRNSRVLGLVAGAPRAAMQVHHQRRIRGTPAGRCRSSANARPADAGVGDVVEVARGFRRHWLAATSTSRSTWQQPAAPSASCPWPPPRRSVEYGGDELSTSRGNSSRAPPALRELIELSARGLSTGYYRAEQVEAALRGAFGVDTTLIEDQTYSRPNCSSLVEGLAAGTLVGSRRLEPQAHPVRRRCARGSRCGAAGSHHRCGEDPRLLHSSAVRAPRRGARIARALRARSARCGLPALRTDGHAARR